MAYWSSGQPGVVGMSVRNELRPNRGQDKSNNDWYNYVTQGASQIHSTNPNLLIMISGINYATDLGFIYNRPLDTSTWANKLVYEAHAYAWDFTGSSCNGMTTKMGRQYGYLLDQGKSFAGPLWMSEFGVGQTGGPNDGLSEGDSAFLSCLVGWLEGNDVDWGYWALQGSYYVRDGLINDDEGYGLLNQYWNETRNPDFAGLLGNLFSMTQGPTGNTAIARRR